MSSFNQNERYLRSWLAKALAPHARRVRVGPFPCTSLEKTRRGGQEVVRMICILEEKEEMQGQIYEERCERPHVMKDDRSRGVNEQEESKHGLNFKT